MVPTGVAEAALIPWPLVPATLISSALIWLPLVAPRATVATVSTVVLSTVTALVALAVLWPARLPTIPMVGGRRAETDAQPETAKAQRAHHRGSRHNFLDTHCCAPSVLWACLRMLSTDPKASTARDRLTLSRDRRLRFEKWRCARMRRTAIPLHGRTT
jgi:hypothetical protein